MTESVVTNLVEAVKTGRSDVVRSVISAYEKGTVSDKDDLNELLNYPITSSGTLLHLAAKQDQADSVRALLTAGADPAVIYEGQTAFDVATAPNVVDVFNYELLQCIAQSNVTRVTQLLSAGVDVNLQDTAVSKNTPMHWAASYANSDTVRCLCNMGSDVNAVNADGATPLHDAVHRGSVSVVKELLHSGALTNIAAVTGKYANQTALDLAESNKDLKCLLSDARAKPVANGLLHATISPDMFNGTVTPQTVSEVSTTGSTRGDGDHLPVKPCNDTASISTLLSSTTLVNDARLNLLWPRPQQILLKDDSSFRLPDNLIVYVVNSDQKGSTFEMLSLWKKQTSVVASLGKVLTIETKLSHKLMAEQTQCVLCEVNRRLFSREESYRISVTATQVKLQASDLRGLCYGITTFIQLLIFCIEDGIPALQIHDYPALRDRGVLLDLSQGRIPSLESLTTDIRMLAYLKINQLQLYYRFDVPAEQDLTWQFPYTRSDMLELERFCDALSIDVVPVLDVATNVSFPDLAALRGSLQSFLSCFTNTPVVGLGMRLSGLLVGQSDNGGLLMDDLWQVLPLSSHHTVQLCSVVLHELGSVVQQLPFNTVLTEYGLQANHDFGKYCKLYSTAGVPFCVVPGTAAWNSLAGCPEAAISNIWNAAKQASAHGGLGLIISHWSGNSQVTHHPFIWPGLMTAAGLAWNPDIPLEFVHTNLAELLNCHMLQDTAGVTGQVVIELGRAETFLLKCATKQKDVETSLHTGDGSTLHQLLLTPDKVDLENLTNDEFQKTMRHLRKCQKELTEAQPQCDDGPQIVAELHLTIDLMMSACKVGRALVSSGKLPEGHVGCSVVNMGIANLSLTTRTDLANRLLVLLETYQTVWKGRCLPGSGDDALHVFSVALKQFVPSDPSNTP
ncbi:hypothetical protein NP493_375g01012 [Ridgeia piscesae]|uniref:Beta-hexosaminidase bacterial type N-terminal domain-containing protein n=1 Tax=Ridgeia piscesae TaxID=27915 RepID=A0AAD9L2E1_RIDPI|nr:hypothetical protein NP493_375g01012 [Ridgeia piscesae]